jgi:ketosteroid isomerase-like protein
MKIKYSFLGSRLFSFVIVFLLSITISHAQKHNSDPAQKKLYAEIMHMDSVLFNAFNSRDLNTIKNIFASDLELYQDNDGLKDYNKSMEGFKNLFTRDYVLTRELVPGSMEVYPIKDFGAIQTASHIFSHVENGKLEKGTFKFVHIWKKENGSWKVCRVITYDH